MNSNYNMEIEYIQSINIEQFDIKKLSLLKSNFITENSRDISDELILYAVMNIDRSTYTIKLASLLNDINVAISIELSIFEFSLIHATLNNIDKQLVPSIYNDKFVDIYMNLDQESRINNKTFKQSILQGIINPKLSAFLSPDQTHPENWAPILNKIKFRETVESNMATTDLYKCYRCGERKSKVTELQLRSADEASNRFVTCLVCYNTFIK